MGLGNWVLRTGSLQSGCRDISDLWIKVKGLGFIEQPP